MSTARLPFVEKSNLNYIPSANELNVIEKQAIDEGERKLLRLSLTITELQDNLASLKIEQNALKRQLENHRAVISPIRKLLSEILQVVFIQCLPPMCNAVMSSREAPLLLGRFCHHWRQVAYATPQLWSSIHIVIATRTSLLHRRYRPPSPEDISTWLHRSGALPLSISICFPTKDPYLSTAWQSANQGIIQLFLDTVAEFKSRWRSLHLSLSSCDWTAALGQFNATDLPLLERLYISGPMDLLLDNSGNHRLQDLSALAKDSGIVRAPRLRSLGIPFYGSEVPQLPIRWENLTSLAILGDAQVFDIPTMSRTLLLCPNLMTCTLCVLRAMWPPEEDPSVTQINLPNLQSISSIDYEQKREWEGLPPADRPPSDFLDTLSLFLGRLITPLEELELAVENVINMDVEGILQLMPDLKRLSLNHLYYSMDDHLLSLTPSRPWDKEGEDRDVIPGNSDNRVLGLGGASSTCSCPNLEVFHCIGVTFSDAALLNFLRSRCSASGTERSSSFARLRKATIMINLQRGVQESEDTRNQIKQLQAANPLALLDVTFVPWVDPPPPINPRKTFSPYDGLESFRRGW